MTREPNNHWTRSGGDAPRARRPDVRFLAAIVTLIAAPYTLANAFAMYAGYSLPFGEIEELGMWQRVAAATLSTAMLLGLLLVALTVALARLRALGSSATEFAWTWLAILLGAAILAGLLLLLLYPVLDLPGLRPWFFLIIAVAEAVWLLAGFLFYLGMGETQ